MNSWNVAMSMIGLGLVAGIFGGMFGIGGGLVMVPALILVFGYEQRSAFGTSLMAQLLPVGLLGVLEYWRRNQIQVASGLWIALGLFIGALIGARLTGLIPKEPMKQSYGLFLVVIGVYFLLSPSTPQGRPQPSTVDPAPSTAAVTAPASATHQVH